MTLNPQIRKAIIAIGEAVEEGEHWQLEIGHGQSVSADGLTAGVHPSHGYYVSQGNVLKDGVIAYGGTILEAIESYERGDARPGMGLKYDL